MALVEPQCLDVLLRRLPGEERGQIFAITEKVFPVLVGDGKSTLGELIAADPRARFLQEIYRRRHLERLDGIPVAGEVVRLVEAGNHAQGCLFLDGARLATPALLDQIEALSRSVPGFHVGRYDVRYSDPAAFGEGRGFRIVELNGAAAEATSVYDPSKRLLDAYRTLFRQWEIVFEAGAALMATPRPAPMAMPRLMPSARLSSATPSAVPRASPRPMPSGSPALLPISKVPHPAPIAPERNHP
jgi:hypothetical protein